MLLQGAATDRFILVLIHHVVLSLFVNQIFDGVRHPQTSARSSRDMAKEILSIHSNQSGKYLALFLQPVL